jgi:hypothetical protein
LRRRATRRLASLKSALSFRAWSAAVPDKTKRIAAFSALFLLSVLITLLVLLSGRNQVDLEPEVEEVSISSVEQIIDDFSGSGAGVGQSIGIGGGAEEALSVQDFILPRDVEGDNPGPYLMRPRLERWQEEQVNRYWIPLEDIAADLVRRENDRRIEKLFEEIP